MDIFMKDSQNNLLKTVYCEAITQIPLFKII